MKNFILICLVAQIAFQGALFAQNFVPVGAKWYYKQSIDMTNLSIGGSYAYFESEKDTILDGKTCQKI